MVVISIHAPARGATLDVDGILAFCGISIHAPARGATSRTLRMSMSVTRFQSTPPRGERRYLLNVINYRRYFNPRPREGSDIYPVSKYNPFSDFNPRPREGSDYHPPGHCGVLYIISIHAPARGATHVTSLTVRTAPLNFNPRPREGSDCKYCSFLLYQSSFLKQYSQISTFSNYTNIESTILILHFPSANLSDISC